MAVYLSKAMVEVGITSIIQDRINSKDKRIDSHMEVKTAITQGTTRLHRITLRHPARAGNPLLQVWADLLVGLHRLLPEPMGHMVAEQHRRRPTIPSLLHMAITHHRAMAGQDTVDRTIDAVEVITIGAGIHTEVVIHIEAVVPIVDNAKQIDCSFTHEDDDMVCEISETC